MGRKILVTGGLGFVGRHLVDALMDRGHQVTALDLRGPPHRQDVAFLEADLRDADAVSRACAGAESVFHNASVVHTRRNREQDVWSVNLDGSRNVLSACQQHGVKRLVYVSSASAVYEGRDIEGGDESLPYSSISQAPYADSKIAAEKMLLAASGEAGVLTCAIRPHVVFGPGDTRFLPAILARARAGKLRFGIGRGKLSDFTYVSNLVDALLSAEERLVPGGGVDGEAFFVTNGEPMPFFDFVGQVLEKLDLPRIRGTVPFPVAYAVAAMAEALDTLKGGTLNSEDGLSRFAVRYMATHHYFSIDKARKALGYDPQVSIAEGIDRTVAHLQAAES
jgi:sterol-4alpha-carboxylate 3-dehydrogenase (decarboxylating)